MITTGTFACRGQEAPAGREASPAPPRRIISLAPSLTETLFALELGGRVVGVDDYAAWPPEVAARPRLGGLFNPNFERAVSLHPDLAVMLPSEHDLVPRFERLGVATLLVPSETLADIERSFGLVARRCGVPRAGAELAARWRADLAPRMPATGERRLRVLLSVGRAPGRLAGMLAAGRGTFLDDLLARLGASNVFADAATSYPQISMEEVVARRPDVILELRSEPTPPRVVAALVHDWQELPAVPAVRTGRVAVIAGDYVTIPGPRLPLLYRQMRDALAFRPQPAPAALRRVVSGAAFGSGGSGGR